jgi:hypothetical protein
LIATLVALLPELAIAQAAPLTVNPMQPGVSVVRPEYATPDGRRPDSRSADAPVSTHELRELLRAQTDAIRALGSKVDALEDSLRRIESKLR